MCSRSSVYGSFTSIEQRVVFQQRYGESCYIESVCAGEAKHVVAVGEDVEHCLAVEFAGWAGEVGAGYVACAAVDDYSMRYRGGFLRERHSDAEKVIEWGLEDVEIRFVADRQATGTQETSLPCTN